MPSTINTVNATDVLQGEDRSTLDAIIAEEAILRTETVTPVAPNNKVVTEADIGSYGGGDMVQANYDTNADFKVDAADNADTVNGLTVLTAVPGVTTEVLRCVPP